MNRGFTPCHSVANLLHPKAFRFNCTFGTRAERKLSCRCCLIRVDSCSYVAILPYNTGESFPSSALRTILMGGVPCFRKASWKPCNVYFPPFMAL